MLINEKILQASLRDALLMGCFTTCENDFSFIQRVYSAGLVKYANRLRALEFSGRNSVLDFGCGYGQWSLALASLNKNVSACDVSPQRTGFLEKLKDDLAISNLDILCCESITLPSEDASFDCVFSYSVLPVVPWRELLAEFYRLLRPNGVLYANANALGWYSFLWMEEYNRVGNYDPKAIAARAFSDTLRYDREGIYEPGMNLIIEPMQLSTELKKLGFGEIKIAAEGSLHIDAAAPRPEAFFQSHYLAQTAVYEFIATKI
jgi:ubiquinone/menaquinone biosynthesis C-methylase UbiE